MNRVVLLRATEARRQLFLGGRSIVRRRRGELGARGTGQAIIGLDKLEGRASVAAGGVDSGS